MKWRAVILVAVLPIVVMAVWTGRHAYYSAYGDMVELPVKGYDPRDLLTGHYLRYRVDYGKYPVCGMRSRERKWKVCVCLHVVGPGRRAIAAWSGNCAERPEWGCSLWLRGYCLYDQFIANIERFHLPEQYASSVPVLPQGASVRVQLDGKGTGLVREMYVDGDRLIDYLKNNAARLPPPAKPPPAEEEEEDPDDLPDPDLPAEGPEREE